MAYLLYTMILIGRHLSVHLVKTSIRVHLNFVVSIFTICNGAYYDQSNSYMLALYGLIDTRPKSLIRPIFNLLDCI